MEAWGLQRPAVLGSNFGSTTYKPFDPVVIYFPPLILSILRDKPEKIMFLTGDTVWSPNSLGPSYPKGHNNFHSSSRSKEIATSFIYGVVGSNNLSIISIYVGTIRWSFETNNTPILKVESKVSDRYFCFLWRFKISHGTPVRLLWCPIAPCPCVIGNQ